MKFPVVIRKRNTLVIADDDFFKRTGHLDPSTGTLDFNVAGDGRAHLHWILDGEGSLTALSSLGLLPGGLLRMLRVRRRRERYRLLPARRIRASELLRLIEGLTDDYPEAPHVADLRNHLSTFRPEEVIDKEKLQHYFGE